MKSDRGGTCLLVFAALLAGCSSPETAGQGPSTERGKQWATDACKTFPATAAAKAAGVAVIAAVPGAKSAVGGNRISTCIYQTSATDSFTVLLRHYGESGGGVEQTVSGLRAQPDITGPVTEMTIEGARAFWAQRHRTLTYVPDEQRVVVVTPPAGPAGAAPMPEQALQAAAMQIARAAAVLPAGG